MVLVPTQKVMEEKTTSFSHAPNYEPPSIGYHPNHIRESRRALHPIHFLPPELLGEIFPHCLAQELGESSAGIELVSIPDDALRSRRYRNISGLSSFERDSVPLRLSHVCSQWRASVFACPSMWARLSLTFDSLPFSKSPVANAERTMEFLRLHLLRSKTYPLDIFLVLAGHAHAHSSLEGPIIELLVAQSSRWRTCSVERLWSLDQLQQLFSPIQNKIPMLQSLSLHFWPRTVEMCPSLELFKEAPSLSRVNLCAVNPREIQVPWNQLDVLTVDNDYLSEMPDVLLLTQDLRTFRINRLFHVGRPVSLQLPPHISTVAIDSILGEVDPEDFEGIRLPPKLQSLEITASELSLSKPSHSALLHLISSPQNTLRRLFLKGLFLFPDQAGELLCSMPQLEDLSIPCWDKLGAADLLGSVLKLPENETQHSFPCPRLVNLAIDDIDVLPPANIEAFVLNRKEQASIHYGTLSSCLESVRFRFRWLSDKNRFEVTNLHGVRVELLHMKL